jgi:hypothetical protein
MVDPYMISTAVLSVIIIAVSIGFLMKSRMGSLPSVETGGIQEFSYTMIVFLPHILMVFGFIADALAQDFRYSIPSIAGIVSIFLNWGFGIAFQKIRDAMSSAPPVPSAPLVGGGASGCFIPGFDTFVSDYSSAPLVVTFTIMFYYLIDLIQNRGIFQSIATIVAMVAFVASQFWILKNNGCFAGFSSIGVPLATSSLLGLLFGGSAYGLIWGVYPERLPSRIFAQHSGAVPLVAGSTPTTNTACPGGKCGAPADDDQFVCDSYINGMPVTK